MIEYMDIGEFRRAGYLQEVNRQFLHPLGLALEVGRDDESGHWAITGVWDYRADPEGIRFAPEVIDDEFVERAERIERIGNRRVDARLAALGYVIQPLEPT